MEGGERSDLLVDVESDDTQRDSVVSDDVDSLKAELKEMVNTVLYEQLIQQIVRLFAMKSSLEDRVTTVLKEMLIQKL